MSCNRACLAMSVAQSLPREPQQLLPVAEVRRQIMHPSAILS